LPKQEGDFEKAVEVLRKKARKSDKRAGNEAKEGVVMAVVNDDHSRGVIVKLSSETDFVAKNQEFIDGVEAIAKAALASFPDSVEALMGQPVGTGTVKTKLDDLLTKFTEKMELSYDRLEAPVVAPYIHMGYKAGVLIGLNKGGEGHFDAGRDVAMQVAAMKPVALDKDNVDPTTIEKEIEIGKEQARQEGKPEAILDKIAMGKLNKFFKENTLLNQQFVKDSKKSVREFLQSIDKELTATDFKHLSIG
jgi:elongation factor Ts